MSGPSSTDSIPWLASDGVMGEVAFTHRFGVRQGRERSPAYARTVSSIPSRVGPCRPRRRTRRLLATSRSSVSRSAPVIASAASTVAPPAKTAKRAKHACSSSSSRLVAPVDRRPQRLLAGGRIAWSAARARRARTSRRAAISLGREQAAAGRRELDRQRQPVEPPADRRDRGRRCRRSSSKSGSCARARSQNSATASTPTSASRSPCVPARAARAVARERRCSA